MWAAACRAHLYRGTERAQNLPGWYLHTISPEGKKEKGGVGG